MRLKDRQVKERRLRKTRAEKSASARSNNARQGANQLRIIGGQWRGRKLSFANGEGLRPTMDRVRETLFNWLQAEIAGARCLDLFSGSGALGFEALSRQAAHVVMVDKNPEAVSAIKHNLKLLRADNAEVLLMDAQQFLHNRTEQVFDIVFLDPPFHQQLMPTLFHLLQQSGCLAPHALIYVEMEKNATLPALPPGWQALKNKKAGQLEYYLIEA
jgi:16S rRNA (guanine966-N2)-methyltransferase